MSMYNYPNWHEIKDLVMIYHEDEWDDAHIKIWNPTEQKEYDLIFCGSSRPNGDIPGEINFVIYPTQERLDREKEDEKKNKITRRKRKEK